MAVRIRTTEKHPHPIWEALIKKYPITEVQGFIFSCTDDELISSTKEGSSNLTLQCIEAAEYDDDDELEPTSFFSVADWQNKIKAANFFGSSMLLLTHKASDSVLFKLQEVIDIGTDVIFKQIRVFTDELEFISWWTSIKKLKQTKLTVEAKARQGLTIFDNIIESHGSSWGGNMDGFILSNSDRNVLAIIEIRQSRSFFIENYDPARYFSGTQSKGGDFKTWLPLVYLKKAYNIPIILITLSTKSGNKFGFTEVFSINYNRLFYVDTISPIKNVTNDFATLCNWIDSRIKN